MSDIMTDALGMFQKWVTSCPLTDWGKYLGVIFDFLEKKLQIPNAEATVQTLLEKC